MPPPVSPAEAPGILVLPSSALPTRGVRIRQTPLLGKAPPLVPRPTWHKPQGCQLSAGLGFHTSTLLPLGGCLRKSRAWFCSEDRGPKGRSCCGQASIPGSPPTSPGLWSASTFPFSPIIVPSLGHCLPFCCKPLCASHPGASSQCLRTHTLSRKCYPAPASPSLSVTDRR